MTDYDIQRTAKAVVDLLLTDDRFLSRMMKMSPKNGRLLTSKQAAGLLGISPYAIRRIAPFLNGIKKGNDKYQHWCFEENGLQERYLNYLNTNQSKHSPS